MNKIEKSIYLLWLFFNSGMGELALFRIDETDSLIFSYRKEGRLEEVIEICADKIKTEGNQWYFQMGLTYFLWNKPQQAIDYFKISPQYAPFFTEYCYFLLGQCYQLLGDSFNSLHWYYRLITEFSGSSLSPEAYLKIIDNLAEKNNLASSIRLGETLRQQNQSLIDKRLISLEIAELYERDNNYEAAKIQYLSVFRPEDNLDSLSHQAYEHFVRLTSPMGEIRDEQTYQIAKYLYKKGQFDEALRYCENVLKRVKDEQLRKEIEFLIGECLFQQKKYLKVIQYFKNFSQKYSSPSLAHVYIGRAEIRLGNLQSGLNQYLTFYRKFPSHHFCDDVLWQVGWIYFNLKKYDQALANFSLLRNNYPNSIFSEQADWRVGYCYFKNKEYPQALTIFKNFLKNNPKSELISKSYYWAAKCCEMTNQFQSAKQFYRLAGQSENAGFYTFLAKAKLGDNARDFQATNNIPVEEWLIKNSRLSLDERSIKEAGTLFQKGKVFYSFGFEEWAEEAFDALDKVVEKDYFLLYQLVLNYEHWSLYHRAFRLAKQFQWVLRPPLFDEAPLIFLRKMYPAYYSEIVQSYAKKYHLDENFIYSVIRQESMFNAHAFSRAGAMGLLQLMPKTASAVAKRIGAPEFIKDELWNPDFNLHLGIYHLHETLLEFKQDFILTLSVYNAGKPITMKWKKEKKNLAMEEFVEEIDYSETRNYIKIILANYWMYKQLYPSMPSPMLVAEISHRDTSASPRAEEIPQTEIKEGSEMIFEKGALPQSLEGVEEDMPIEENHAD